MKNIPIQQFIQEFQKLHSAPTHLNNYVSASRLYASLSTYRITHRFYAASIKDSRREINRYLTDRGFILYMYGGSWIHVLPHATEDHLVGGVTVEIDGSTLTVAWCGDQAVGEEIMAYIKDKYQDVSLVIQTASHLDRHGDISYQTANVPLSDFPVPQQSYYPWLSIDLNAYFDALLAAPEAVLVLYGPPGTGKSSLIRALIAHTKKGATLAFDPKVVACPELINHFYADTKTPLMVYEDIDAQMRAREDGNQLMSTILNASEGIVRRPGKKIIFSTNLSSIDRIDPALLRVGRCFDILKFELLTPAEANQARTDTGMPAKDFSSKHEWSLAEALAADHPAQQTINRYGRKAGF